LYVRYDVVRVRKLTRGKLVRGQSNAPRDERDELVLFTDDKLHYY
jgi:hypothetical protein